jgi:tetratricopeptide (TPR) repeat protein
VVDTTVIDKSKLVQTVYELVENEDSILELPKQDQVGSVEIIAQSFLEGAISICYSPEDNALVWHMIATSEKRDICVELSNLGANLAERGMFDDAIRVLEQAVRLNPSDEVAHLNLGHAYQDKGIKKKAITHLKRALKLKPDLEDAYERLGTVYSANNMLDEALACYKHALELNPSDRVALLNLGYAYYDMGRFDKAIEEIKRGLNIDRSNELATFVLIKAYHENGQIDDAINECKIATELYPKTGHFHGMLGKMYLEKGQLDQAIEEYRRCVELDKDASSHNDLGGAYAEKGFWAKALKEYRKALQLDPEFEYARHNLAIALQQTGPLSERKKPRLLMTLREEEAYRVLNRFENALRSFIQGAMEEAFGKQWWKQRVPYDVQVRCLDRKNKRETIPFEKKEELHPIYYADFLDYTFILTRKDNWKQVFSKYFRDETWLSVKLKELNPTRTDVAHNRKISSYSMQRLKTNVDDLLHCIRKPEN